MRTIVYLNAPAHGHVNPTLPVVQELVQRGEQVIYYNTEEFRPQIERSGATFRAYPPMELTSAVLSELVGNGNLASVTDLMLRTTETLLPFMLDELPAVQPDLIIFDSLALWGRMAATLLNVRAAASISHFVFDESQARPGDIIRLLRLVLPSVPGIVAARFRLVRRFGKTAFPSAQPLFPMRGGLNILYTARDLQPALPLIDQTFRFVGPSINPQMRDEDFPFDALGAGTVVYISLGTVHHTQTEFYKQCFAAFADYPAQFILSVGNQTDTQAWGATPANFIVRPSVPQLAVLQRADAFVTHGGMNSLHEGLYYGVPLLLIPHQFEQLLNARLAASQGVGLVIENQVTRGRVMAGELRRGLETLLAGSGYREAAQRVQGMLRATGGYRQAADEIQAYLG